MTNKDSLLEELKAVLPDLTTEELALLVEYIRLNPSGNSEDASPFQ